LSEQQKQDVDGRDKPGHDENMVNQTFTGRLRIRFRHIISLLSPFFSDYSINIKRFA